MITKQAIDYIISICKQYIDEVLRGWGLSKEEKELVAFEKEHMPYTKYSGNQSVDHALFRKFLRRFNLDDIKNDIIRELNEEIAVIRDENEQIKKENEALRKKTQEIEQLSYAGL